MSVALADLSTRLDEVRLLSALDPSKTGDTTQPNRSNAVNRACILLLSAHLEGYLEDLVVESLDTIVQQGAAVDDLPLLLRALHVEEHLRKMDGLRDRNARAPRIRTMLAAEAGLWASGSTVQAGMLRPKMVCAEMSNPGSREIAQFLQFIGVDIDAHLRAVGRMAVFDQVNGLVGRRNAIAHGEASASATYTDIDSYLGVVSELSRELDVAVAQRVQTVCALPTLPW